MVLRAVVRRRHGVPRRWHSALLLCIPAALLLLLLRASTRPSPKASSGTAVDQGASKLLQAGQDLGAGPLEQQRTAGGTAAALPGRAAGSAGAALPDFDAAAAGAAAETPNLDAHRVHAFFYLWYGNPEHDGRWLHWNHAILPHWDAKEAAKYPSGSRFRPPEQLHSPYYPARGPYSSADPETLRGQMREAKEAGIFVLAVSWWGPKWRAEGADTQGVHTDLLMPTVLQAAELEGVKIAFHLEPYPGRNASSVAQDLNYIADSYGSSPALLRMRSSVTAAPVPVFYVYDSYLTPPEEWATILVAGAKSSIRGTQMDGFFIGLWLGEGDGEKHIEPAGFDGFYTYFASETSSYSADPKNWQELQSWATAHRKLFVPSVAPGYLDSRIRPWNKAAKRGREGGARYCRYWERALEVGAAVVSITSFNEWGEGTQIEPARVWAPPSSEYEQYGSQPGDEALYLRLTKKYADEMARQLELPHAQQGVLEEVAALEAAEAAQEGWGELAAGEQQGGLMAGEQHEGGGVFEQQGSIETGHAQQGAGGKSQQGAALNALGRKRSVEQQGNIMRQSGAQQQGSAEQQGLELDLVEVDSAQQGERGGGGGVRGAAVEGRGIGLRQEAGRGTQEQGVVTLGAQGGALGGKQGANAEAGAGEVFLNESAAAQERNALLEEIFGRGGAAAER